jgi:hypothetical protein
MQRTRVPLPLLFATLVAFILGTWLALSGLAMRLFGSVPVDGGWIGILGRLSFGPELYAAVRTDTQAWLRIVVGSALSGAVTGLWLRQRWALPSTVLLCALGATFSSLAWIAAPMILVCLAFPSSQNRVRPIIETNASPVSA